MSHKSLSSTSEVQFGVLPSPLTEDISSDVVVMKSVCPSGLKTALVTLRAAVLDTYGSSALHGCMDAHEANAESQGKMGPRGMYEANAGSSENIYPQDRCSTLWGP